MNWSYLGSRKPEESLVYELLLSTPPDQVAVDVETISLEYPEPIGLSIAVSPTDAFYFPILPEASTYLTDVIKLLQRPDILKIFHNSLYDLKALAEYKLDQSNIVDTLIMAHLAGERFADLPYLATSIGIALPELPKLKQWIWDLTLEQIVTKCCTDAQATYALYQHYKGEVDSEYLAVEMKLIPILITMSGKGIKVDQPLRAVIEAELADELKVYEELADELGFNPGSPKQVAFMLAKDGVFLPMTKKRKSLRTDEATLRKITHPIAVLALTYRHSKKLYSTYIRPLTGEERCHTNFHMDAITGRVSSARHNLQNIPKGRMRSIFLPDNSPFTDLDFSQIELRTLAHIAQDDAMQAIFDSEGDIHQATAELMETSRYKAKSTNFAMIYGATDETLMETAGVVSKAKAQELRLAWSRAYPKAGSWIEAQQQSAPRAGHITTLYGRRIPLPSEMEEKPDRIRRKAVNYPIQASAAEIVKRAMIECDEAGLLETMRLQVHDEMLFDGNVVTDIEKLGLNSIAPFPTPYEIKLLDRWE